MVRFYSVGFNTLGEVGCEHFSRCALPMGSGVGGGLETASAQDS